MRRFLKVHLDGSITVEAAVLVPLILSLFASIILLLFYYHDKNVVAAVAQETLVVQGQEVSEAMELEQYFHRRIGKKLLLFSHVGVVAKIKEKEISISCKARKKRFTLQVQQDMSRTRPESHIRTIRRLKQAGEQIQEKVEEKNEHILQE
ncbi:MAG: TadE family protein [Faecalimonas sp.]|nr:TadE family protein [Faecalimonas sp.]